MDYAVWSALAPYLDLASLLEVRQVHQDGAHPFPRDEPRTLLSLELRGSSKSRYRCVEFADATAPVPEDVPCASLACMVHQYAGTRASFGYMTFKGFGPSAPGWGTYVETMRRRLQRYLTLRAARVDTAGRITTVTGPSEVLDASYVLFMGSWAKHRANVTVGLADGTRVGLVVGYDNVSVV